MVPTEWQVPTVLGDCISKAKVISIQAAQYRQYALISDFLDLANLAIRLEAALATVTGPAMSSLPKNMTADVRYAINKCESLGSGKQLILHGHPSAIAQDFSPHIAVLRRHFLPIMQFQCCMILKGTLGGNFDIFAATSGSAAWVLLWKTRSRPIGVRVCPVAQFNFLSTAFDRRGWTMVVFWKEDSGRQPQPSPPTLTFFDDPNVPFGPSGPPEFSGLPGSPGPPDLTTRMASSSITDW